MAVKVNLGVHLGFAITRYPEPEEWARVVSEELGLRYVQFVSDLLQPNFPDDVIEEQAGKITDAAKKYGIVIKDTFTSPRWNFFGHPEENIRRYWLVWFKKFADISRKLGAVSTGSLLGIYSAKDLQLRNDFIFSEVLESWHELASHAGKIGLEYLTWEPMSIGREMGETIPEVQRILAGIEKTRPAVPILLCLDVDHGAAGTDPYEWLKVFGSKSPILHIKQRTKNVFGHKPFTEEHNKEGIIFPEKVIGALEKSGAREATLYLELSFREREPYESNVISDLKKSVDFWKPFVSN